MIYLGLGEIIGNPSSSNSSWASGVEAKQLEGPRFPEKQWQSQAIDARKCFHMALVSVNPN